jgi:hypothetical protein
VKVLKKGKVPAGWHKKLKCTGAGNNTKGCGATLLVLEEDIFKIRLWNRHDIEYNQGRFCCPECGTVTDLRESDNKNCHPRGKKPTDAELREIRTIWNARHKKRHADTALSKLILAKQKRAEAALRRRELAERGHW